MKGKRLAASVAIALIALLSIAVAAGSILDTAKLVTQPVGGRAYTPQCLVDCHLVLQIKPGTLADLTKSVQDSYKASFIDAFQTQKANCIAESHYEIYVNESYDTQVWKADVKCTDSKVYNATLGKDETKRTCVDNGKYEAVKGWRMTWKPLDATWKPADKAQTYYIDLVAKRKLTPECKRVDAVPTILGQELKQYAWWDNNWGYKQVINITANEWTPVNYTWNVSLDVAALVAGGKLQADYDDLRVVFADTTELDLNITNSWVEFHNLIAMDAGQMTQNYTFYYGNSMAGQYAHNPNNIYLFYDNFTDGVDRLPIEGDGNAACVFTYDTTNGVLNHTLTAGGRQCYKVVNLAGKGANGNFTLMTRYRLTSGASTYPGLTLANDAVDNDLIYSWDRVLAPVGLAAADKVAGAYTVRNTSGTSAPVTGTWYEMKVNTWGPNGAGWREAWADGDHIIGSSGPTITGNSYVGPLSGTTANDIVEWDWFLAKIYVSPEPSYALNPEETVPALNPLIIKANTTNGFTFRNGDIFITTITVLNATPLGSVGTVAIEFNGANHTAYDFGSGLYNWNATLAGLTGGTYAVKQYARNDTQEWLTNTSNYFSIAVLAGLNLSDFNGGNGTAISSWNVYITNGTADYTGTGLTNPTYIPYASLPLGTDTVTFYKSPYKNASYLATVNATHFTTVNGQSFLYQQFNAANIRTSAAISSFSLTAANATTSASFSTATGTVLAGLDQLPYGTVTFTTQAAGFVSNISTLAVGGSSQLNTTFLLAPAGLGIQALDEKLTTALTFNLTMFNSSNTYTFNNIGYSEWLWGSASLPTGDVTLTVSSLNYGQRNYFLNINDHSYTNLTAYLLATSSGSWVRFHILTTTEAGIQGALVQANRSIGGTSTMVEQEISDASGTALFFLDPLATYTITVTKAGYSSYSAGIQPSQSDYKIYLTPTNSNINISGQFFDVTWTFFPASGGLANASTQLFNYTIASSNSSLTGYGLNITLNGTMVYSGSGNSPGGGSVSTTLDLTNYSGTTLTAVLYFTKVGYPLYNVSYDYTIWPNTGTLAGTLSGLLASVCPGGGIQKLGITWCGPLAFLALFMMMLVGAAGASTFGLNGGGMAAGATMWLFVFIGFFPWQAAFVLTLGMLGLVVLRGGM
jgi:hypothetical protein